MGIEEIRAQTGIEEMAIVLEEMVEDLSEAFEVAVTAAIEVKGQPGEAGPPILRTPMLLNYLYPQECPLRALLEQFHSNPNSEGVISVVGGVVDSTHIIPRDIMVVGPEGPIQIALR